MTVASAVQLAERERDVYFRPRTVLVVIGILVASFILLKPLGAPSITNAPQDAAARKAIAPVICYPVETLPRPDLAAQGAVGKDDVAGYLDKYPAG